MACDVDFGIEILKPASGDDFVDAGETPNLTATLYDAEGGSLAKSAVKSVVMSVYDEAGAVINSRNEVDILDNNDCTLAADGTLTVRFATADTAYQQAEGVSEYHTVQIKWTWDDSEAVERTGKKAWRMPIRRVPG